MVSAAKQRRSHRAVRTRAAEQILQYVLISARSW